MACLILNKREEASPCVPTGMVSLAQELGAEAALGSQPFGLALWDRAEFRDEINPMKCPGFSKSHI